MPTEKPGPCPRPCTAVALLVMLAVASACAPANGPAGGPAPSPVSPVRAATAAAPPTAAPRPSPFPSPSATPLFPAVGADDWQAGPADARVTIVMYSDYQSPMCASVAAVLARLTQKYPHDARWVLRHHPQDENDKARLAAEAAEAAGAQGGFWEMSRLLFAEQAAWAGLSPADFRKALGGYAARLGLDAQRFGDDLAAGRYRPRIEAAAAAAQFRLPDGTLARLPGVPFLLVNDQPYQGPTAFWAFETLVKLELLRERQFAGPESVIDPLKEYTATLATARGDIVLKLFADQAPATVNNFVFLAQRGWYDGITFHRVLPGRLAQTGDPTGTGFGGPGYYLRDEIVPGLRFDRPGMVGMASAGPDANGSQFFITLGAAPELAGRHTIFGQVVQGLDVAQDLSPRDPSLNPEAPDGDTLRSVTIQEH